MARLSAFFKPRVVPVESFSRKAATRRPNKPPPPCGAIWGAPSYIRFNVDPENKAPGSTGDWGYAGLEEALIRHGVGVPESEDGTVEGFDEYDIGDTVTGGLDVDEEGYANTEDWSGVAVGQSLVDQVYGANPLNTPDGDIWNRRDLFFIKKFVEETEEEETTPWGLTRITPVKTHVTLYVRWGDLPKFGFDFTEYHQYDLDQDGTGGGTAGLRPPGWPGSP